MRERFGQGISVADDYASTLQATSQICEGDWSLLHPPNELAVQARWFAGGFGTRFVATTGEPVVVLDFGTWNREAGPDFTNAIVKVGDAPPRRGSIEIDGDVRDWEHHGHSLDTAFDSTLLHVFLRQPSVRVFTRTTDHREVLQVLLREPLDHDPAASSALNKIVTTDLETASALLHAAARYRFNRKSDLFRAATELRGADNAWFEALAIALGYKRNKLPFQLLAQRATLARAGTDHGEGLLFGLSGFLEDSPALPPSVALREYLRKLWSDWWDVRSHNERLLLQRKNWSFAGNRPTNHPHRRVAALAIVAQQWTTVRAELADPDPRKLNDLLERLEHPFWSSHYNLAARPLSQPLALIGPERRRDITINIHLPIHLARTPRLWDQYVTVSGPPPSQPIRRAALDFFATESAAFLRPAVHQQGLLQLLNDFHSASNPGLLLARWRGSQCCK